jgi:hypothetical protein
MHPTETEFRLLPLILGLWRERLLLATNRHEVERAALRFARQVAIALGDPEDPIRQTLEQAIREGAAWRVRELRASLH